MVALLALLLGAVPDAGLAAHTHRVVSGLVVGLDGQPVAGAVVFAVDATKDAIVALAMSDSTGHVRMRLADRRHDFGVMSARYGVRKLVAKGSLGFTLELGPIPDVMGPAPDAEAPVIRAFGALLVRGRVVDERGAGLAGVRVDGMRAVEWQTRPEGRRAIGQPVATAISDASGRFVLAIPGGDTQIQARAPGLILARSALQEVNGVARADRPVLIMAIAADAQEVMVADGRVLRIRPQDSIDPEYVPPAPVRAWLLYAYGICPSTQPLRAHEKRALKKYWYLDVLRRDPPNPATVSVGACASPTALGEVPLTMRSGVGALDGFEVPLID